MQLDRRNFLFLLNVTHCVFDVENYDFRREEKNGLRDRFNAFDFSFLFRQNFRFTADDLRSENEEVLMGKKIGCKN